MPRTPKFGRPLFQAIIFDRKKSILTNIPLTIDNRTVKSFPSVGRLGIHLNDK